MTHLRCHHRITVEAPVARAFMYFTPAGESHWVEGWKPTYLHPSDGRTEPGMVFTTGEGAEHTVWMLADFDRGAHRSRYLRCTPGSRLVVVEIACRALDAQTTEVEVAYTLTALTSTASAPSSIVRWPASIVTSRRAVTRRSVILRLPAVGSHHKDWQSLCHQPCRRISISFATGARIGAPAR